MGAKRVLVGHCVKRGQLQATTGVGLLRGVGGCSGRICVWFVGR